MSAVSGEAPRAGRYPILAKYDVLEELGHGGMATVYRARDRRLARDVAVKVIHPHLRDSGEVARRFSIEAQAVAKLRHPNIVEVFDVSAEGEGEQYLVVELLRGRTLRKILQASGPLPPEIAAAIGVELLSALGHAHEHGVVHRDVKPENVILEHRPPREAGARDPGSAKQLPSGRPGDRVVVKLTDFGIAKLLDVQGMTSTGQVLGSPAHMAPEQIEGQEVDARSDVFGMGVLLYECMVGHLPFEGNNPAQVLRRVLDGIYPSAESERPVVGRAWSLILDKALGRTPAERYDDAAHMRDALVQELTRLGLPTPRASLEEYCDDPEAFTARHDKAMVAVLCERALAARKRGEAMAAAADYNRALAYSPHDPSLLRIVASLHGAEARRRFVRRVAPLGLGTILLGAAAFGVTKELRQRHADPGAVPTQTAIAATAEPVIATPTGSAAPLPSASAIAPLKSVTPRGPTPIASGPKPTKSVTREVRFGDVWPPNIVRVALDNEAPQDLPASVPLPDDKAHVLKFSCRGGGGVDGPKTYCKGDERAIPAGDKSPDPVSVRLSLLAAPLTIHGNSSYHYMLDDGTSVAEGHNSVPMTNSTQRTVRVQESETRRAETVHLIAGKEVEVTFGGAGGP